MSDLLSGTGNPMYGNHTLNLGRIYTPDRNRRVSEAVKKWAKLHPEHYHKIGVLGAQKARKMGLYHIPTGLEAIMKKALRKHKIRYVAQYNYGIGIMDFYLPEGNIALFVDGGVWHADPRLFNAEDILFFGLYESIGYQADEEIVLDNGVIFFNPSTSNGELSFLNNTMAVYKDMIEGGLNITTVAWQV
jgi:hypothetical protein